MKKIVSLLIILILLLCSSCLAFSDIDLKQVSYNIFTKINNLSDTTSNSYIDTFTWSALASYFDNSNYYFFIHSSDALGGSNIYTYISIILVDNRKPYIYNYNNNYYYRIGNVNKICSLILSSAGYQFEQNNNYNFDFTIRHDQSVQIFYSPVDLYDTSGSSIWVHAPWIKPSFLFDNSPYNKQFQININTISNTQYISIGTSDNDTISNIPVIYNNNFGRFIDDTWLVYQFYCLDFWYWNGSNWVYKLLFLKSSQNGFARLSNNSYMSFIYSDHNTYEEYELFLNEIYSFKNVVFHFQVVNGLNDSADGYFLLGDSNTIISNGTLDTSNLGSDYFKQFENLDLIINDNNNTQDLINEINDNNDFWKNTYDNLFAMDSGDVNDIFTTIQPYISSGDSPIGFYNVLFDSLSDDPSDFVISWNNIPIRLTLFNGQEIFSGDLISGNRINFSEACRENETLATILNWVRIFNVLFFITSYLYTIYICILVILGISLTFVDPPEPEHRQIGFINDWRDK